MRPNGPGPFKWSILGASDQSCLSLAQSGKILGAICSLCLLETQWKADVDKEPFDRRHQHGSAVPTAHGSVFESLSKDLVESQ